MPHLLVTAQARITDTLDALVERPGRTLRLCFCLLLALTPMTGLAMALLLSQGLDVAAIATFVGGALGMVALTLIAAAIAP